MLVQNCQPCRYEKREICMTQNTGMQRGDNFLAPYGGSDGMLPPKKKQQNFENEVSQDSEWLHNCISRDV